jgi:Flp pilus assembly protein TadD
MVAALAAAPFLPALGGDFTNWDDPANLLRNEAFRGLGWTHLRWMLTTTLMGHYIPLTWMSLGLNYVLGGMDPWGYHLGNVLLHAANAALFFLVARSLLRAAFIDSPLSPAAASLGAAVAALVFGVHPLRVESVAWVTERRDVLCGLFYCLAVLAYLRGTREGGLLRGPWSWLSLLAFGAALLSKAIAMTLPLTLLLLDVYPLRRTRIGWRALLLEKAPHAAMAIAGAAVAVVAVSVGAAWTAYDTYGPTARVTMVAYSFWFYPRKFVLPTHLSPLYELPVRIDPWQPEFLWAWTGLVLVSLGLVALRRRFPGGLAAWLHSAIVLAPVSGIVHAGHQLAHDRYSYLSGLGFAVLAGAGVVWSLQARDAGRLRTPFGVLVAAGVVAVVLGWGGASWRQSHFWRSSEALWTAATNVDPGCAICHNNLGIAMVRGGPPTFERIATAEAAFRRAIVLNPGRIDPYTNLGALLAWQGRLPEADPVFLEIMRRWPEVAEGPMRLGMLRTAQGRPAEAVRLLRQALQMGPDVTLARSELALALTALGRQRLREGRAAQAEDIFLESATIAPNNLEPLRGVGQARLQQGRAREAVAPLRQAAELAPKDALVRFWLAKAYLAAGEPDLAGAEIVVLRGLDHGLAEQVSRNP